MAVTTSSIATGTGTLSAAGVGSGLDVKGLVSQLMTVEQRPLTLLANQEAKYQAKLSGLGSVKGALSSLQTAAKGLVSASSARYTAAASDTTVLSAKAGSEAVAGNYGVSVTRLAQSQKLLAAGQASTTAAIGAGSSTTVRIAFGTISGASPVDGRYTGADFAVNGDRPGGSLTIGSGKNTLAGIRDAINAAKLGATATIINDGGDKPYRLAISSTATGAASSLRITVTGDDDIESLLSYNPGEDPPATTQRLEETQSAQNAALVVDGVGISSASNSVTGPVQGVTLNLTKKTAQDSPITVTVQRDTGALSSALSSLVKAVNDTNKTIVGLTGKGQVLQGDSAMLGMQSRMRGILYRPVPGDGTYSTLSSIGISFQKDGTLVLDSTKVSAAISADYESVAALAAAVAGAIDTAATGLLGESGPILTGISGINTSITSLGTRRTAIQNHLDMVQARYQKQFSALDTLISSMNSTSNYLTQQLANLPKLYNNSNS